MYKNLKIKMFFTPEGKPTCATSFPDGEVCPFLRTRFYGQEAFCLFKESERLEYSNGGLGYSMPHEKCPVHGENNELR